MYAIYRTKTFEKSFKKLQASGRIKPSVVSSLEEVITCLSQKQKLHETFRDHALAGEFYGYRECHIQGDLLLVYQIIDQQLVLVLVDIGSHSQIFG